MKPTFAVLSAVAAGSALFVTGGASAAQQDSATGGGQVLIGSRGGAGDTIAFTAKGTPEAATGQVQYVDRSADGQEVYHGDVTCVTIDGNTARISGVWDNQGEGAFSLYVEDNGEGSKAAGEDIVTVTQLQDPQCGDDFQDPSDMLALARGNAQVRDNTP